MNHEQYVKRTLETVEKWRVKLEEYGFVQPDPPVHALLWMFTELGELVDKHMSRFPQYVRHHEPDDDGLTDELADVAMMAASYINLVGKGSQHHNFRVPTGVTVYDLLKIQGDIYKYIEKPNQDTRANIDQLRRATLRFLHYLSAYALCQGYSLDVLVERRMKWRYEHLKERNLR